MNTGIRSAKFDSLALPSDVVAPCTKYSVEEKALVLNPTPDRMHLNNSSNTVVAPFSSIIVVKDQITPSTQALIINLKQSSRVDYFNYFKNWEAYPGKFASLSGEEFEKNIFLRSEQDELGVYSFAPDTLVNKNLSAKSRSQQFLVKANLWVAKQSTHCGLHNQHDFIEIHTQVTGHGRMQKFKDDKYESLCEQIMMSPGYTTSQSYCDYDPSKLTFNYPYHQFYADTDSVWLALEYYPLVKDYDNE